jgi:hypothetical protein
MLSMLPYLVLLRAEFSCFHSNNRYCYRLVKGPSILPVPGIEIIVLDILSVPLFLQPSLKLRLAERLLGLPAEALAKVGRALPFALPYRSPDFPPSSSN